MPSAPSPDPRSESAHAEVSVCLIGFDEAAAALIEGRWPQAGPRLERSTVEALIRGAEAGAGSAGAVLCFGDRTVPADAARAIRAELQRAEGPLQFLVLAAGDELELFEDFVERDLIFYLTSRQPPSDALLPLVEAAVAAVSADASGDDQLGHTVHARAEAKWSLGEPSPEVLREVAEIERTRGLAEALARLEEAAMEVVSCRRAHCRFVDAESLTLWRPEGVTEAAEINEDGDRDSAVAGLVGFVARTGRTVKIDRLDEDGRYDPEADNGQRSGRERLLAVALPGTSTGSGAVEAVLSLARGSRQDPFHEADRRQIEHLAREVGPILRRRRITAFQARQHSRTEVFRREALEHRDQGLRTRSEPLRVVPDWLGRAYRSILWVGVLALLILPFAGSDEFAMGEAVVRLGEKVEVRSKAAGVLENLWVRAGDRVQAGQELGRLDSSRERAELEQLDRELEQRLVERLRRPGAPADAASFVALRERRRVADTRLQQLILRAPVDAVVGDLLVRPGRPLSAGQPVVNLGAKGPGVEGSTDPRIEVLLPGRYRPLLEPGMEVRFRIHGYDDVELMLEVSNIGSQVLSSEWANRLVGASFDPAGAAEGMVIVGADLPTDVFESEGRDYPYFDGMSGSAEIRVRKRRFVLDWLRSLRSGGDR